MTDHPGDDFIPDPDIDDAFDLVADNALDWWSCPCDVHLFYLGVAAGQVEGFAPRYTVGAAAKHLAQLIADDELDLPQGVDPFRLKDLVQALYPPDDDG